MLKGQVPLPGEAVLSPKSLLSPGAGEKLGGSRGDSCAVPWLRGPGPSARLPLPSGASHPHAP